MLPLEPRSGTYALVLLSRGRRTLRVGRLGRLATRPGSYVYVGSAFGPGGLAGRVGRHLRPSARHHWHIDALRAYAPVVELWITTDPVRREHQWAALLLAAAGAELPLRGFGASDCDCASHLIYFPGRPSVATFRRRVRAAWPGHAPVGSRVVRALPDGAVTAR